MKVAFLNGISMSDNVSKYMAAIGVILSKEYNCMVTLGSNYISNHMLQDCFSGKIKEEGIAHAPYRFLYGSQEYCNALWSMKRNRQGDILEIPMEGVTIIFPPDAVEKSMFYYDVPKTSFYLLDVAGENRTVFQNVIEEADKIVVFLPQDVTEIHKFFHRFSSLIPKAIVVIEEVQRVNRLFYRKIVAEYGINNKNIGVIPKNNEFKDACEEGKLEAFLNQIRATKSPQYNFLSGAKGTARMIYEQGVQEKAKESERN